MRKSTEGPTRLIFVRHLDTRARQVREALKGDERSKELRLLINKKAFSPQELTQIQTDGQVLLKEYGLLPRDPILPILSTEIPLGRQIGRVLVEQFGIPNRWEVSSFLRARQSSQALREGIQQVSGSLPSEIINPLLRERDFGEASEYPSTQIYLATHPTELFKWRRNAATYTLDGGESKRGFRRRQGLQVFLEKWHPKYKGKTSVMVTHSLVIEEHLRRHIHFTDGNDNIWTGSVTVLEAEPKKFLRPRRYRLVGQVGQHLV